MNLDIRLKVGLFSNLKIKRLERLLGDSGIISLQKLWIYVAVNNPNGALDGFSDEDIEIICERGNTDRILPVLLDLVLLEKTETGFVVHDWEENNPWAANAGKRSEQARKAIKVRWDKKSV